MVKKTKVLIFSMWNEQLFYCIASTNLSKHFRKTYEISFKAYFIENKKKHYHKINFTDFCQILGEFLINFRQLSVILI